MKKIIRILLILSLVSYPANAGVSVSGLSVSGGLSVSNYETGTIGITSPVQYRVYQRSGTSRSVTITGTYTGNPSGIQASFNGGAWTTITTSQSGGTFSGALTMAQGQGTLSVRFLGNTAITASVSDIGVGDVYLCAGQSNMSGRGIANQSYSNATLKATLYGNDNTWKNLVDPYDSATSQMDTVSSDSSPDAAGSWIPLLATGIMADRSVPVAFVPCAKGSTSSTEWQPGADHQDRSTLYGSCVYRANQVGGVKAVLWWQGETDAAAAVAQATYNANLDTIINAFQTDLTVKSVLVILQNSTSITDADEQKIRDATAEAIADNSNAIQGPDFSDISSDDGFHLRTNGNLQTAADRWLTALNNGGV